MKKIIPFCLFFLSFITIKSQIILTNRILPAVNDNLPYGIDTTFINQKIEAEGQDMLWDYSFLTEEASGNTIYRDPSTGQGKADFPTANAMLRQGNQERYLKISTNKVEELGTYTRNAGQGGVPTFGSNVYAKPVIIQRVPSSYEDELEINTDNSFKFSSSFLPDSLLKQLPIKPDSFRVGISSKQIKLIDSWGKLKLPAKTWDALREKRTTTTTFLIEAKVPFLGWIDVTTIAQGTFNNLLSGGTTVSYAFLTNDAKGDILLLSTDSTGNITRAQFKPNNWQVATHNSEISNAKVYPTTFIDKLTIEFPFVIENMNAALLTVDGKTLINFKLNNCQTYTIENLEKLPSGMYILKLQNNYVQLIK